MALAHAPATILVYVGLDRLGDGLMKLPFVRALRAAFPHARITWLAGKGASHFAGPLRPLTDGLLDEIIDHAGIGSHPRELLTKPLNGRRFDLVIDTQRRLLTTLILRRIKTSCFISAAAGYAFSDRRPPLSRSCKSQGLVRQLLDLVELASGRPAAAQTELRIPESILAASRALLPDGATYLGVAPGAGGRVKCWPLARFVIVAQRAAALGVVPVFLLGPEESELAAEIAAAVPQALFPLQAHSDAASPLLTIALARRLKVGIANDSGCGHLLAAGGVPLISLFGPTQATKFAPLATQSRIITAQTFGGTTMASIPVAAVIDALQTMLQPTMPVDAPATGPAALAQAAPA